MKLDNTELLNQRTKLLFEIKELIGHLETLKDNINYVYSLNNIPGIFFRVKDLIYIITADGIVNVGACTLHLDDTLPSIMFKPLDRDVPIEYYETVEGKIEALDIFKEYISNNAEVILHELVHIDDQRNGIEKPDGKSVSANPYDYYNHPAEIRAYTQQFLYTAINEIYEAINNGEIKTKDDLKKFTRIYKKYKDIFTKKKLKNAYVYWKPITFKDYLENLDFVIDLVSNYLPE